MCGVGVQRLVKQVVQEIGTGGVRGIAASRVVGGEVVHVRSGGHGVASGQCDGLGLAVGRGGYGEVQATPNVP